MTTTSSVPPNTRASSPWRTARYSQTPRSCSTTPQAFLLSNLCACPDCGVSGQRPAGRSKVQLLAGAAGLHQGHQHPPGVPSHQHPAGPPDLQGPEGSNGHPQGQSQTQSCSQPVWLPRASINFADFLFPSVFLQYQRHQRWGALRLPRPCSGVWWGRQPGQDQRVCNSR